MLLKVRSFVSFSRNLALVFLAIAVFGWALNARMGLPKAPTARTLDPAKLSTERNSPKVLKALEQKSSEKSPSAAVTLAFVFSLLLAVPALESITHRAEIALSSPSRFYLHAFYSLNRPPPALL
jgi:hypothetical protein